MKVSNITLIPILFDNNIKKKKLDKLYLDLIILSNESIKLFLSDQCNWYLPKILRQFLQHYK